MKAGAASIDITPPDGLDLSGGAFGPSRGILHRLQASALWLEDGVERVLLVSCDLLGFSADYALAVRHGIAGAVGVPVENIVLSATHTHCAPATVFLRYWGTEDPAYKADLQQRLIQLAQSSYASRREAALGVASASCPGVAVIRTSYGDRLTDDRLAVLGVYDVTGAPLAVAVNFGCHPVNLHQSGHVSPDFPHHVRQFMQAELGNVPVLYLGGPGGDVNPANFDFAAIAAGVTSLEQQDLLAADTARPIAVAALQALAAAALQEGGKLRTAKRVVRIPLVPLPGRAELESILAASRDALTRLAVDATDWDYTRHATYVEWAEAALAARDPGGERETLELTIQAFGLGQAVLVAIPGELFTAYGRRIRDAAGAAVPFVVTLANGCVGYFTTPAAHERRTYEAIYCPRHLGLQCFAPDAAERLTDACEQMVQQLAGGPDAPRENTE